LLREGITIGVMVLLRYQVRPFTAKQIELATTFADQAVIAIENVRLFEAEQARTRELTESLQQQSATSNVLEVISRSAFDLQPVFDTVAESAVKLCGAERAFIFRFDGELLHAIAAYNCPPDFKEWVVQHPIKPGRHSGSARAALERRTIHIPDWKRKTSGSAAGGGPFFILLRSCSRRNPMSCVKSITLCLSRHRYRVGIHRTTGRAGWPEIKEMIHATPGQLCCARMRKSNFRGGHGIRCMGR
jgi:hypothetical protein